MFYGCIGRAAGFAGNFLQTVASANGLFGTGHHTPGNRVQRQTGIDLYNRGGDSNLDFWLGTALMAVPLTGLLAVLALFASEYLKRAQATVRTRTAWTAGVIAAVCADIAFLGTLAAPSPVFGMKPGQVHWGLVALSATFVVIGVAMIAVLTVASRGSRPGKPPPPGPRNSQQGSTKQAGPTLQRAT